MRAGRHARRRSRIYALLDSPSLTGAYRFVVDARRADASSRSRRRLFLRDEVQKLGIAPLTSMFFHGENTQRARSTTSAPRCTTPTALLLALRDRRVALAAARQPRALHVSALRGRGPTGFGLIQRDRDFDHYQDLETRAERRPERRGSRRRATGAPGRVELVEIPTNADINDNIVAYWVPERQLAAGRAARVRLHACTGTATTRRGRPAGASSPPAATAARSRARTASSSTSAARSSAPVPADAGAARRRDASRAATRSAASRSISTW